MSLYLTQLKVFKPKILSKFSQAKQRISY